MEIVIVRMDVIILEGIRGRERQNRLVEKGKSYTRWPNSNHNVEAVPEPSNDFVPQSSEEYAHAVDVAPYPIDWLNEERFKRMGFYVLGIADALYEKGVNEHRVRWGADWDMDFIPVDEDPDEEFFDSPHFELVH
jgi:peptidoglycan L-alanyl-D-glutamate endopeptidase CwlK